MHLRFYVVVLLLLISAVSSAPAKGTTQEELPDDYLPLSFVRIDDRLEGGSEFLEGFSFTLDAPRGLLGGELSNDMLFALVGDRSLSGVVIYPTGKTTEIEFEIVRHRGIDEIYMKSSLGYFLLEYLVVDANKLSFAVYWWYCPPASDEDLEIIKMAEVVLKDPRHWNNDDDRQCENDIETNQWSLFCALKFSTMEIAGEYNHHGLAIQSARFAIDELVPGHGFEHTLMDYNNAASTSHLDIMHVLDMARVRIENELNTRPYGTESVYDPANGDIIFHTSQSSQSAAIQLATKSQYSHMGIVYIRDGRPVVFEAVEPVKATPLDEWAARGEDGHYVVKRLSNAAVVLSPDVLARMQRIGEGFGGNHYDLYFECSDERIYCSELVWKIYKRGLGVEIGELQVLGDFDLSSPAVRKKLKERWGNNPPMDEKVISPAAMFESELLVEVYPGGSSKQ